MPSDGRAIVQAVSRRLPTVAARVQAQVRSCGICGGQSDAVTDFHRVLQFPLPILIPPTAPNSSSSIIWGWYNRPKRGRRTKWTQSHPTPRNQTCRLGLEDKTFCSQARVGVDMYLSNPLRHIPEYINIQIYN
jgi:hypothetical protein